jgi:hypothetical protein
MEKLCESERAGGTETNPPVMDVAEAARRCARKTMLREAVAEAKAIKEALGGASVLDVMATWVAGQYLLAVRQRMAELTVEAERIKLLQAAAQDVALLQNGIRWSARLKLEQKKLDFKRQQHRDAIEVAKPIVRERPDFFRPLTPEERQAMEERADRLFGLKHD